MWWTAAAAAAANNKAMNRHRVQEYTHSAGLCCATVPHQASRVYAHPPQVQLKSVRIRIWKVYDSICLYTMSEYTLNIHIYQYIYLQDLYPQFKTTHPTCIYPEKLDLVLSLYVCCAAALLGSEFCIWTGWRLNIYI